MRDLSQSSGVGDFDKLRDDCDKERENERELERDLEEREYDLERDLGLVRCLCKALYCDSSSSKLPGWPRFDDFSLLECLSPGSFSFGFLLLLEEIGIQY